MEKRCYILARALTTVELRKGPSIRYVPCGEIRANDTIRIIVTADDDFGYSWGLMFGHAKRRDMWVSMDCVEVVKRLDNDKTVGRLSKNGAVS